jgi:hypothetical protein
MIQAKYGFGTTILHRQTPAMVLQYDYCSTASYIINAAWASNMLAMPIV